MADPVAKVTVSVAGAADSVVNVTASKAGVVVSMANSVVDMDAAD